MICRSVGRRIRSIAGRSDNRTDLNLRTDSARLRSERTLRPKQLEHKYQTYRRVVNRTATDPDTRRLPKFETPFRTVSGVTSNFEAPAENNT